MMNFNMNEKHAIYEALRGCTADSFPVYRDPRRAEKNACFEYHPDETYRPSSCTGMARVRIDDTYVDVSYADYLDIEKDIAEELYRDYLTDDAYEQEMEKEATLDWVA